MPASAEILCKTGVLRVSEYLCAGDLRQPQQWLSGMLFMLENKRRQQHWRSHS